MNSIIIKAKRFIMPLGRGLLRGDLKKHPDALILIAPVIILFMTFFIYPIICIVYYGFMDYDGMTKPSFIGFYNYTRLFKDDNWWSAVINNLIIGIGTVCLQIPIALAAAAILNTSIRGRNIYRAAIFVPNITSQAIMGMVFFFIFEDYQGMLNTLLNTLGIINQPIHWLGDEWLAKLTVVLFATWYHTGFKMVFFLAAMQKIPVEIYESADIDGTNTIQRFWHVTLPMISSMFRIVIMIAITDALRFFDTVRTLTNGGPVGATEIMGTYIFNYYFSGQYISQQGYASALSVIATIIIAIITVIYLKFTKKFVMDN